MEVEKFFVLVLLLPNDEAYRVIISNRGKITETFSCYDIMSGTDTLYDTAGTLYAGVITPGKYQIEIQPEEAIQMPEELEGNIIYMSQEPFEYSPVNAMADEEKAGSRTYLSAETINSILLYAFICVCTAGVITLILMFVHLWRRCHGQPMHSKWIVIIPHLCYVVAFMGLTLFVTYYLYTIGLARNISAACAVLMLALLATRGSLRRREWPNVLVTAGLYALTVVTFLYYAKIPQMHFGVLNIICYCLIMFGLCYTAIRTFDGFGRK